MITKIISCADIHIRNYKRNEEYEQQLRKFIEQCKNIAEDNGPENTRIVIAGDLLHNKLDISGEGYTMASWLLTSLDKICKTLVIAGNHDINMSNLNRLDPITTIFSICHFDQTYFLDKELDYESGCIEDDNVIWCLYSSFNDFEKPNIDEIKIQNPDKTFVGLYHGDLRSAKSDAGYESENGLDPSYFDGIDFGILGHIHKRQEIVYNGIKLVYCGSLIQQDHGENIHGHGFVVWNIEDENYETIDIDNEEYGFVTMKIKDIKDIDNNEEKILNQ